MTPPLPVVCFVRSGRPPTANKRGGSRVQRAKEEMTDLYREAGGDLSARHRYGVVYYFVLGYRPANDADADNVSKRVWDALEGSAYKDDEVVRLRIAGVVEAGPVQDEAPALQELDLSDMSRTTARKLLRLIAAGEKHILYVELGPVSPAMFAFNLAARGERRES